MLNEIVLPSRGARVLSLSRIESRMTHYDSTTLTRFSLTPVENSPYNEPAVFVSPCDDNTAFPLPRQ
jgi:hypothetical protein